MADHEFAGTLSVTDKIGIGDRKEPNAQLDIFSSTAPSQIFLESGGALLKLSVDASGAALGTDNAFPLSIKTDDTPRISIDKIGNISLSGALSVQNSLTVSGNVGIGTTSPSYKLTIAAGDINIDDGRALRQAGRWVIGGDSKVLSIGSSDKSDGRDISFDPGLAGALTIKKDTGNVGIGTTNPKVKLEVVGNINTTGIISGSHLPPNLIRNSYMNILDGSKPAGYSVRGNVTLEAAHPYTKGFEGPYVLERPPNAATSVDTATLTNPYWFGVYYKGQRASRGGLADGWCGLPDGKILKITGNNSGEHTIVYFPFEQNVLTNRVHFKAWLKIASGSKVGFGVDSGYLNVSRGLIITKQQTDTAPDGWYQIDALIDISKVTYLGWNAFAMGIEASGTFEVYLALPYLAILDNDTWLPSVSDMLSRDGLTVHPGSGNVGIGTTSPNFGLDVRGNNGWIGSADSSQTQGGWRLGRWPNNPPNSIVYLTRADSTSYQNLAVGALYASGRQVFGTADDLAEMTPVKAEDNLEPGDVVVIENPPDNRVLLARSNKPYDSKVAGVISDPSTAALIIGGSLPTDVNRDDIKPLALAGRVLTKVTTENGSINAGDFLTTSSTPGYAMRAVDAGYTLGKALQSFYGRQNGETVGKVWILVNLGWFSGFTSGQQ